MSPIRLLGMPMEIRQQIYHDMLLQDPRCLAILQTCRQIFNESAHIIYKRPLKFPSPAHLAQWFDAVGTRYLRHVVDLTLHLEDHCCQLLNQGHPGANAMVAKEHEAKHVIGITRHLTNLRELHLLRPNTPSRCEDHRRFEQQLLEAFCTSSTQLENVSWQSDTISLTPLSSLSNLRSLRFPGFSSDSAESIRRTLAALPKFRSLHIVPCSFETTLASRLSGTRSLLHPQPLNPSLIAELPHLSVIFIEEHTIWSEKPFNFFEPMILEALRASHSNNLQSIGIRLDAHPTIESLKSLQKLLKCSSIEFLQLGWPEMDPELLEVWLPVSLQRLDLTVHCVKAAIRLMRALRSALPKLPNLTRFLVDIRRPRDDLFSRIQFPVKEAPDLPNPPTRESLAITKGLAAEWDALVQSIRKTGVQITALGYNHVTSPT